MLIMKDIKTFYSFQLLCKGAQIGQEDNPVLEIRASFLLNDGVPRFLLGLAAYTEFVFEDES